MVQVAVVGAGCAVPGLFLGGYRFPLAAVAAAVATALVATALAFVLQVTGQRTVPPTRAALLLLLEPVFAGVLAGIVEEPLGTVQVLGAGVILVAIVCSELGPVWLDRPVRPREAGPDNDRSQGGPVA
jgi:drug/metabolite transporter (DMT)-like permease